MKQLISLLTVVSSSVLFAAGEPEWPSDFETKVAARETARTAAKSSVATANAAPIVLAAAVADKALDSAYTCVFQWWLAGVTGFDFDTDARMGLYIIVK